MQTNVLVARAQVIQDGGRLFVGVPWSRADYFRNFFKAKGIGSTLHLDLGKREARLELWTNVGIDRIRELLGTQTV